MDHADGEPIAPPPDTAAPADESTATAPSEPSGGSAVKAKRSGRSGKYTVRQHVSKSMRNLFPRTGAEKGHRVARGAVSDVDAILQTVGSLLVQSIKSNHTNRTGKGSTVTAQDVTRAAIVCFGHASPDLLAAILQ